MPKITIDTAHAEIAREIRLAKKRMFAAHRAGLPLYAARDAFVSDVEDVITEQDYQLRGNPPKAERIARETTGAGTSRERHDLADAVATILQSDVAPPRLRDAVVAHVTDSEPPTEHVEDQPSAEETHSTIDQVLVQMREIEALAKKAVFCGDRDQQLALLTMLHRIVDAGHDSYQLSFSAMMACFKECDALIDDAVDYTVNVLAKRSQE